jgi:CheY-like chemotaxis protein
MFTQLDTSVERSRDGLGIGLTLVKNLVEMHDGSITVQSAGRGLGSEFTIRLPLLDDSAMSDDVTSIAASEPPSMRRVLVVDDNHDGAASLAMLLQLSGHETFLAHDGQAAIDEAERLRPDVMLLDIGLPGMSGYEVCRNIREQSWGRDLVMVAVTGWGQADDRHRSRAAGFDAHIVKPVDPVLLTKLLSPTATNSTAS